MSIDRAVEIAKNEGLSALARKSWDFVKFKLNLREKYHRLIIPYAIRKIKGIKFNSIEELVDFSFSWLSGLIRPMQVKEEITELLKLLSDRKPKVILEIGTANGGTLFLFTRVVARDATIISIDLPGGKFGGGYPDWKVPLYKAFALPDQKIHLIRADSHDPKTLDTVSRILNGRKIEFLFIDGDHTYEGVKKDFEMYSPIVRKGGIVAFHDIVPGPEDNVGGVPKFWQEIRERYKYQEIVKDWNHGGYGIGILFV
ncbi:O-methyltransferase-like protein [Ferroglobus placidus DSM 10642]|uniref:O-methyltransferase-like protein n=1 Tax=Ferroglobus placidus (strain DSM 10642 / AEDII12DO) TaxID=589924 RepID=D3S225_FERPA|nr:class I SAM-dependent methyltransferase [Ferroglobus placidus]ADC66516.1 O-methyltransferase-like protein [Ferroglobus placidus DSM 10642]